MEEQRRKSTRNRVWPETVAKLEFKGKSADGNDGMATITAQVDNLSASGMFVLTETPIPVSTEVELVIDFEPGEHPPNAIKATGVVVRQEDHGIAIEFKTIDTLLLGECILAKLKSKKNS